MSSYLDTVRGPLLPVLTQSLGLKYSESSWFLVLGNIAAIAMTFLMVPLVRWMGEKKLALLILSFAILAVCDAFWVDQFSALLYFALLLGAAVSTAGAVTNLLVIRGSEARLRSHMLCALHLMYGLGSLVAPFVVKWGVANGISWRWLITGVIPALAGLLAWVAFGVPDESPAPPRVERVRGRDLWLQLVVVVAFALYVGGEVTLSMWMVTYLVDFRHLPLTEAASYASGFFVVMSITRFFCVFYLPSSGDGKVLWGSLVLCCIFFVCGHLGWTLGFSLAGILGPYFPLFLSKAGREFPETSRTLTLWILSCMQVTLALCHWLVGRFTDLVGIETTYWLPLVLMALAMVALFFYEFSRKRPQVLESIPEGLGVGGVA